MQILVRVLILVAEIQDQTQVDEVIRLFQEYLSENGFIM